MATHATTWFGVMSNAASSMPAGTAVVKAGSLFLPATAANVATYGFPVGVALTPASANNPSFEYQVAGVLSDALSGVGTGSANDWVIVAADGSLERTASLGGSDVVVGVCPNASGDVVIAIALGRAIGATLPIDLTTDVTGTLPVANGGTGVTTSTGTGATVRNTSPTFLTSVSYGPTPSTFGEIRLSNGWFLWSRDSSNGLNISLIGLDTDDVIRIGSTLAGGYPGADVEIDVGASQAIRIKSQETSICGNVVQIGRYAGGTPDGAGGIGVVGWDDASSGPSGTPGAGKNVIWFDSGTLKYKNAAGTTVTLDGGVSIGTALQTLRTNSGATATEWALAPGAEVVNIMDYYQVGDGGASYNLGGVAVTTKNIAMAMDRAYDAMIATKKAYTLWIPPAYLYGVEAYSWKEPLVWEVRASSGTGDNVGGFEILGSGQSSIIIPDNSAANDSKLYVSAAGPAGMSTLFGYRRVWWMGDEDDTIDCASVLKTSVDMEVLVDECCFYAVEAATSAEGVLHLDCMGCIVRRTNFHGCTNADGGGGGVVNVSTGTFGASFVHTNFYPWEKDKNPLGGTHYTKSGTAKYYIILRGGGLSDAAYTKTRFYADACTFDDSGVYGCVWANPGSQYIEILHLFRCNVYGNPIRLIEAESNVWHTIVEECTIDHNNGAQPTIHLKAATCERLSILRTNIKTANLEVRANTGQTSIVVEASVIPILTVDGAVSVSIDGASSIGTYQCGTTPALPTKEPVTTITRNAATDYTPTMTELMRYRIRLAGTTGGATNFILPADANIDGAAYRVRNDTGSNATLKKSGGTGVTIATGMTADIEYNHTAGDWVRSTADA